MLTNFSVFLIMIIMSSVAAQTFQYSKGWKNGKRDGPVTRLDIDRLENIINDRQMQKLLYLLDGQVDRLLAPCEYEEEPRRQKLNIARDSFDNFQ